MPNRPDRPSASPRMLREIRLYRLLGMSTTEIGARIGRHRTRVWVLIRAYDLDRPEAPLERTRLSLDVLHDQCVEEALGRTGEEGRALKGVAIRMAGEMRRLAVAAEKLEQGDEPDESETETDDFSLAAARQRLGADGAGHESKAKAGEGDGGLQPDHRTGDAADGPEPLADPCPRYTGSAAGPLADMLVHGRTRRWQDTGGGGMAALVAVAGRLPPGSAGRANPP